MLHSIRLIIVDVAPSSSKIAVEMYEAIVDTRYGGWREDWRRTVSGFGGAEQAEEEFQRHEYQDGPDTSRLWITGSAFSWM